MIIFILLFVCFSISHKQADAVSRTKLIIDHDGGADDTMAIFMALLFESYFHGPHIIGITTVHGNVDEPQAFNNTQRILNIAKRRDVPIYRGSNFPLVAPKSKKDYYFGIDGLGDNYHKPFYYIKAQSLSAAGALIRHSKKFKGNLIVVAIGPITNIALAIKLDPEFISRLKHLYIGIGNIYSKEYPKAEFNAINDVEAYSIVAQNGSPDKVTVLPYSQVISSLNINKEWRTNVLGTIPTDIMAAQNSFERISLGSSDTWALLDPAVMAIMLNNDVIKETKYSQNNIILCGSERGIITNNFTNKDEANMKIIYSANQDVYKKTLIKIFSAEIPK